MNKISPTPQASAEVELLPANIIYNADEGAQGSQAARSQPVVPQHQQVVYDGSHAAAPPQQAFPQAMPLQAFPQALPNTGPSSPGSEAEDQPQPIVKLQTLTAKEVANHIGDPMFASQLPNNYFTAEQQLELFGPPPSYEAVVAATAAQAASPPPAKSVSDVLAAKAAVFMPGGATLAPRFDVPYETHMSVDGPTVHNDALNADINALAGFFLRFNDKPTVVVHCRGHHTERRTSGSGKNRRSYTVDVTDWQFSIDATEWVLPIGYISSLPNPQTGIARTLADVLTEYALDTNKMKRITMHKTVGWDFQRLHELIRQQIRACGWHRLLTIAFPFENFAVCARSDSALANCYASPLTDIFCILTCLCIFWYPAMACYRNSYDDSLRSHFGTHITAEEWFAANQHRFRPWGG